MEIEKEKSPGDLVLNNIPCIANEHEHKHGCHSSDALAIYQHEEEDGSVWYDSYCYSCNQYFNKEETHNSSAGVHLGIKDGEIVEKKSFNIRPKPEPLTRQQVKDFIIKTGYKSNNYRGIRDDVSQFFGHLTKLDANGNVVARYYPETQGTNVTGYKCRNHPKNFNYGKLGLTGQSCDLSGQIKFKGHSKYVLIVGGCEDKAAAYQMLLDSQRDRGYTDMEPIAVVCPTTGEPSAYKQVAAQYEYLDTFEFIVIGMDSDEAGRKAAAKIAEVLPEDKVKIAIWSGKDPNQMLNDGKAKQFVRDFYQAKPFVQDGIKSSATMMQAVLDELNTPRLTLPSYMRKMQENMGGGILDCTITNIIADTSVGKSSHVNNMVYHWIFNSPNPITILSLEATEGQWGTDMLSLHLKINLRWMDEQERLHFLSQPEIIEKCNELFFRDNGEPRFYIVDEREGKIDKVEKQLERAFKQYGSRIFIIDVLTDILRGMDSEHQESHMKWQKMFIKKGSRLINVLHTRKPPKSKDGKPVPISEYDAYGSGTFVQSAAINILLERDKEAEDSIEKNTTYVRMPKCRGGITGDCGEWYFDFKTRQVYDKKAYFENGGMAQEFVNNAQNISFDEESGGIFEME